MEGFGLVDFEVGADPVPADDPNAASSTQVVRLGEIELTQGLILPRVYMMKGRVRGAT